MYKRQVLVDPVTNALRTYQWKDGVHTMLDTPINRVGAVSGNGTIAGEVIDFSYCWARWAAPTATWGR